MLRITLTLFVLATLLSCQKEDISIEASYTLEKGQTVSFDQGDLAIRFFKIADSRCPINALCASAGSVEIELIISSNNTESIVNLNTGSIKLDTIVDSNYGDYELQIKEVKPYPGDGDTSPYQIVFNLNEL